jgi:hypothetical protein
VGPRVGLDAVEKRKILPLPRNEPRPSSPYPVAIPNELSRLLDGWYINSNLEGREWWPKRGLSRHLYGGTEEHHVKLQS